MIRINEKTRSGYRAPWRRRISNQLAAFAAIMLFASTQVGTPEDVRIDNNARTQVASQGTLSDLGSSQLELATSLDHASGDSTRKNTKSSKKRFELNLFRFRR